MGVTGFTSLIVDGKVDTGVEFLLQCAKGMTPCYNQREGLGKALYIPLPPPTLETEMETNPALKFHWNALQETISKLGKFTAMTREERHTLHASECKERKDSWDRVEESRAKEDRKYTSIRAEVEAWNSEEEYAELKKFALCQIDMCHKKTPWEYYPTPPFDEWVENRIASLRRDVVDYTISVEENRKRLNQCRTWVEGLFESLGAPKNYEAPVKDNSEQPDLVDLFSHLDD